MRNNLKNIIRFILPCIFISYMVGISFFMHTHIVNGVTIVHSHPYDSDIAHDHNTSEVELIHSLNSATFTDNIIDNDFGIPFFRLLSILDNFQIISEIPVIAAGNIIPRAPPVV